MVINGGFSVLGVLLVKKRCSQHTGCSCCEETVESACWLF